MTGGVMATLFAFAAVVQYNDPDPLAWTVLYSGVGAVSALAALGRPLPYGISLSIGLIALAWGASMPLRVPSADVYSYMSTPGR